MTKRERRWIKEKPRRTESVQPGLFAGAPGERRIGSGFYCRMGSDRIDTAVCIVRQSREPGKCVGCGQFKP